MQCSNVPEVGPKEGLHEFGIELPVLQIDRLQGPPVVDSVHGAQDLRGHQEEVAVVDGHPSVLALQNKNIGTVNMGLK